MEAPLTYFMKKVLTDKENQRKFFDKLLRESSMSYELTLKQDEGKQQ